MEEARKVEQEIETDELSIEARETIVMVMDGTAVYEKLEKMIGTDLKEYAREGMDTLFNRFLVGCAPGVEMADAKILANVAPNLDAVPARQKRDLADSFHAARNGVKVLVTRTVSLLKISPTAARRAVLNGQELPKEVG